MRNKSLFLIAIVVLSFALLFTVHAQQIIPPDDSIWGLAWSADNTKVATAHNGTVDIRSAASGQVISTLQSGTTFRLSALIWSPDGTKIAAANVNKKVFIWNASNGQLLYTLQGQNTDYMVDMVWKSDSTQLAAVSQLDGRLEIWNASNGQSISSTRHGALTGLDWYGNQLVSGTGNGVVIIDAVTGQYVKDVGIQDSEVTSVAWSPTGDRIASGGTDGTVRIWNTSTGQELYRLTGHTLPVTSIDWKSNGTNLSSASLDGTVRVWNTSNGQLIQTVQYGIPILTIQYSPDGIKLAYGGADTNVQIITAPTIALPTAVPSPTPLPPVVGGRGLLGQYYDNVDLTNWKLNRVDSTVNFNWGQGSPDSSIATDTFSVRWTGEVVPQYSQTYTFYTQTDDGVRLWVNNQQVVNDWTNHGTLEFSGTIALTAGTPYNIRMEYYDSSSAAVAQLYWSSSSQPKQIIPTDRLLPNGRIVFQTNRDGNDEIYSMNADGTSPVNLSGNSGSDTSPTAYAGTQKIVFASSRTGDYEIDSMGLTGGTVTNLTQISSYDQYPSQAPDGRIAFASTRNGGNFNLWKINADGMGLTQLTSTATDAERYSTWSPDGQWIIYASEVNGIQDLWKISASGGTPTRLTQNAGSNSTPSWSPDGTMIIFHTTRNAGANEIYLMDANGLNQRPFRIGGLNGFDPVWSPDGTYITYHAWANGQPEIYTIALGSTVNTNLTNNSVVDGYPAWGAQ